MKTVCWSRMSSTGQKSGQYLNLDICTFHNCSLVMMMASFCFRSQMTLFFTSFELSIIFNLKI